MKRHVILSAGLVALLLPSAASANDGTPPWIHELVQNGQDVEVTLAIIDTGEPGLEAAYTLSRSWTDESTGDRTHNVVENRVFDKDEADSTSDPGCRWWDTEDPQFCVQDPEACEDCDLDQVPECYGWCETTYFFKVVDDCVPADAMHYGLFEAGDDSEIDGKDIDVTDADEECTPAGDTDTDSDADGDADAGSSADDDPGGVGCSTLVGPTARPTVFTLLPMLLH